MSLQHLDQAVVYALLENNLSLEDDISLGNRCYFKQMKLGFC